MKTIVITGANRGIGLGLTQFYSERSWKVFALCRMASDDLRSLPVHIIEGFDLALSVDEMQKITTQISKIDLLVNNAAQWGDEMLGNIDYDVIQQNFNVNAVGPLKVIETFLCRMAKGTKIIFMTSRMGSISDNTSGGRYAYRMSKSALNAAAKSVSVDLKPKVIPVGIIHPGWVQTEMGGPNALISVNKAAADINTIIENLDIENSGTFWHSNGEVLAW